MTVVGKARNLLTLKKNSQAVLRPKLNGKHSSLARGLLLACSHIPFNTLGNKANGARLEGGTWLEESQEGSPRCYKWELGALPPRGQNTSKLLQYWR